MKKFHFKGWHIIAPLFVKIITFNSAVAITIYPFVFYGSSKTKMNVITKNHETIHLLQQEELGMVGLVLVILTNLTFQSWLYGLPFLFLFYILYLANYLVNLFVFKKSWLAYKMVLFEREAYRNSNHLYYPSIRKHFSWICE